MFFRGLAAYHALRFRVLQAARYLVYNLAARGAPVPEQLEASTFMSSKPQLPLLPCLP